MSRKFERDVAEVFEPLLNPDLMHLGARGGRGGGKGHFFAEQLVEDSLYWRGLRSVCMREVQKTLEHSSKKLIELKLAKFGLGAADGFKVYDKVIETPGDGIVLFQGMQDHTAESVKSLEAMNRGWFDEAQNASAVSIDLILPTFFRVPNCQLWWSWNPKTPPDPEHPYYSVDGLLRGEYTPPPPKSCVVEVNFTDNPWFPPGLAEQEKHARLHRHPEDYGHIWLGKYQTRSEARVFHNWTRRNFITRGNPLYRFGADFGFSVDPSVLVRGFIGKWLNDDPNTNVAIPDEAGRVLFIDREAWRVGCDVDHTPALFAGPCPFPVEDHRHWKNPYGDQGIQGAREWTMIADSARPETINYLHRHGFSKIEAAVKGPGSLNEGVEFLKAYEIVVHATHCPHVADELTYYSFKIDKQTLRVLPVLEDKKNHAIDATRYMLEPIRLKRRGFFS